MTYIDPHVTLGLRRGASAAEIKDAYRRLCLQHHPDLCPPAQKAAAERYFKEISSAYQQLSRQASGSTSYATAGASAAAHAHWAARNAAAGPGKYSNGVVAAVVAAPLFLLGLWMQRKSQSPYLKSGFSTRPDGLLNPPVNEYLREDLRPRTHSRSSFWSKGWNGGSSRKEMGSPLKKTAAAAAAAAVTPS